MGQSIAQRSLVRGQLTKQELLYYTKGWIRYTLLGTPEGGATDLPVSYDRETVTKMNRLSRRKLILRTIQTTGAAVIVPAVRATTAPKQPPRQARPGIA